MAWICRFERHFGSVKDADLVAIFAVHHQRRVFVSRRRQYSKVVGIFVSDRLDKIQVGPPAFGREGFLALNPACSIVGMLDPRLRPANADGSNDKAAFD